MLGFFFLFSFFFKKPATYVSPHTKHPTTSPAGGLWGAGFALLVEWDAAGMMLWPVLGLVGTHGKCLW